MTSSAAIFAASAIAVIDPCQSPGTVRLASADV
jgi:hypothetical protein